MPLKLIAPVARARATPRTGSSWGITEVGATRTPFDGSGTVVAVLDTGINRGHPAFKGMNDDIVEKDFTGEGDGDFDGHGTHCAGTIFGRNVDGFRIGVARGIKRALIGKVIGRGGGSTAALVEAIQWAATQGAHVISMSLGLDYPGLVAALQRKGVPIELATSRALGAYRDTIRLFDKLAAFLGQQGTIADSAPLLVAAAGNESRRDRQREWRIGASPPATAEGFLAIAALAKSSARGLVVAPFSNTGAAVSAPGVDIVSAGAEGSLISLSGTSMAAPHAAGVAALWVQKLRVAGRPLDVHFLRRELEANARPLGRNDDGDDVGAGIVRAPSH